jgi:hypothetical protein
MSAQIIALKDRADFRNPAEFSPPRLFACELRCRRHAAPAWVLPGSSGSVLRAPMSTLDAELNDFGAQLAMLGGHAADSDG